jgi:hypothetical protein
MAFYLTLDFQRKANQERRDNYRPEEEYAYVTTAGLGL